MFSRGFPESIGIMLGFALRSLGGNEKWSHGECRGLREEAQPILTRGGKRAEEGNESTKEDTGRNDSGVWKYYSREDIDGISGFVFLNYFNKYAI